MSCGWQKLETIEKKLDDIDERLAKCENSCYNMDTHINFVEATYDSLRSPLNYIQTKFSALTGSQTKELPQITEK